MSDIYKVKKWAKNEEFFIEAYHQLKRSLSREQIENLKMSSFCPYLDVNRHQIDFDLKPENIQGFILFQNTDGTNIILEYKEQQFFTVDFTRVNEVFNSYEVTGEYNPFMSAKTDEAKKTQNYFLIQSGLKEILEYDSVYQAKIIEEQDREEQAEIEFNNWLEEAHEIKHFQLVHRTMDSTLYTFVSLYEKDGVYKLLCTESGCFDSSSSELKIEKLDQLLKNDYSIETLEKLKEVHALIHEKPLLESKIKAFRKNDSDDKSFKQKI